MEAGCQRVGPEPKPPTLPSNDNLHLDGVGSRGRCEHGPGERPPQEGDTLMWILGWVGAIRNSPMLSKALTVTPQWSARPSSPGVTVGGTFLDLLVRLV